MTPEQLLDFIHQGEAMIQKSLNPQESLRFAQEENMPVAGDTPENAQQHYLNTGLTIIKTAIDTHLKQTRRING